MLVPTHPRRVELPGDLVLRTVECVADVERLAEFNAGIHEEEVGVLTRRLLLDHPATRPHHWPLVEHPRDGIVSALCLIPWRVRMGGAELSAAEMGIVGTAVNYRKRGLIRRLVEYFNGELEAGGFDLTHIQGIPYFYRQFGYDYAVPLIPDLRLDPEAIKGDRHGYFVRAAGVEDAGRICELAEEAGADLDLGCLRDEEVWKYLIGGPSAGEGETWCLCSGNRVEGYFRTHREGFGSGLIVSEASRLTEDQAA